MPVGSVRRDGMGSPEPCAGAEANVQREGPDSPEPRSTVIHRPAILPGRPKNAVKQRPQASKPNI